MGFQGRVPVFRPLLTVLQKDKRHDFQIGIKNLG